MAVRWLSALVVDLDADLDLDLVARVVLHVDPVDLSDQRVVVPLAHVKTSELFVVIHVVDIFVVVIAIFSTISDIFGDARFLMLFILGVVEVWQAEVKLVAHAFLRQR